MNMACSPRPFPGKALAVSFIPWGYVVLKLSTLLSSHFLKELTALKSATRQMESRHIRSVKLTPTGSSTVAANFCTASSKSLTLRGISTPQFSELPLALKSELCHRAPAIARLLTSTESFIGIKPLAVLIAQYMYFEVSSEAQRRLRPPHIHRRCHQAPGHRQDARSDGVGDGLLNAEVWGGCDGGECSPPQFQVLRAALNRLPPPKCLWGSRQQVGYRG